MTLRLLSHRDRSSKELRERLAQKGFADGEISDALSRARELGYLDDRRFAIERARSLVRQGKAVGQRLALELRRHGVESVDIDAAETAADEEFPLEEVLRDLLERRYAGFDYHRASDKERSRVVNYFQRRGFPLSLVLAILKEER